MGIQAPGANEYPTATLTALLSYNRPYLLIGIFMLVFVITYLLSKKNLSLSLIFAATVTSIVAFYIVINYSSNLRF